MIEFADVRDGTLGRFSSAGPAGVRSGADEPRNSESNLAADGTQAAIGAANERRRIARNLHDGAQQRLVVLRIGLENLVNILDEDPVGARALATRLSNEAQQALEELRALAHGVQPPELSDFGLVPALQFLSQGSPVPVAFTTRGVGRYPEAIEDAVYFICCEALQNAIKHATGAMMITLTLVADDDRLRFDINDNGVGFDGKPHAGTGLASMRQRAAAVNGRVDITSAAGSGTRVHGRVPTHLPRAR